MNSPVNAATHRTGHENLTAHIGVHTDHYHRLTNLVVPATVAVYDDGDGWAEWGEDRDNGINNPDVHHIIITGPDIPTLLAVLRSALADEHLVPIEGGYADQSQCPEDWYGCRISITTFADWAEKVLELDTIVPTLL